MDNNLKHFSYSTRRYGTSNQSLIYTFKSMNIKKNDSYLSFYLK